MSSKNIVAASFGKDSTAMIHLLLEHGERIDEVMFFETGWDFPEMEIHIAQVVKNTGIKPVRLRHYRHFDELLGRWGWPDPAGGWCVDCKIKACNQFFRSIHGTIECIGFTTDEVYRTKPLSTNRKTWPVRYPLIEYGFSQVNTLKYCRALGYTWSGLYDTFRRVSCFCCPKAGPNRVDILRTKFPALYNRYLAMDKIARSAGKP